MVYANGCFLVFELFFSYNSDGNSTHSSSHSQKCSEYSPDECTFSFKPCFQSEAIELSCLKCKLVNGVISWVFFISYYMRQKKRGKLSEEDSCDFKYLFYSGFHLFAVNLMIYVVILSLTKHDTGALQTCFLLFKMAGSFCYKVISP